MLTEGTTESLCGTIYFLAQDQKLIYCGFSPPDSESARLPGTLKELIETAGGRIKKLPPSGELYSREEAVQEVHLFGPLISEYIAHTVSGKEVPPPPMRFYGTEFQSSVWRALLDIPLGEVTTYGAVASAAGCPRAVRAVGSAVGTNPLAPIVPCHRVLPL
ncbi:MAG: MGMT family protein, partial [Spirochaetia bacterium]